MPERIQLQRTKGWRKPEGAIVVARPSKWGNPYTIAMMRERIYVVCDALGDDSADLDPAEMAVEAFRCDLQYGPDSPWWWFGSHMNIIRGDITELRGRDLACWCPASPCHADVLLEIANQGANG